MTILAWDGHCLAADTALWKDNYTHYRSRKLFILRRGAEAPFQEELENLAVYAATGDIGLCTKVARWLRVGGEKPVIPENDHESSFGIVVSAGRNCYGVGGEMEIVPVYSVPHADGGGHQVVLGAMLAGASAPEAVRLACTRTSWGGGPVEFVDMRKPPMAVEEYLLK